MGNVSDAVIQFLSSSKTRMAILGLLVLTTGVFTTIYLVGQQQDIRQRAGFEPNSNKPADYVWQDVNITELGNYLDNGGQYWQSIENSDGTTSYQIGMPNQSIAQTSGGQSCECYYGGSTYYDCNVCNSIQNQPPPGTGNPPSVGGTGFTSSSGSTHCAETCGPQGKNYSCPSLFGGRTCSNSNFLGLCTRCETPQATVTPTPPPVDTTNTPTPTLTGENACDLLSTNKPNECSCTTPNQCASGNCFKESSSANTGLCKPPVITPPSPTITADPACAGSTNKQNGCVCEINAHCASGFCGFTSNTSPKTCQENGPVNLTCDPNNDGAINILDFQWWRDEFTGKVNTKVADCFSPNNAVDLQDFQIWREIFITHERQPF